MEKITDLTFLQNFTSGNAERIKKLVNIFLDKTPGSLEQLEKVKTNSDWELAKRTLHLLKPNGQYLGIKTLTPLIEIIEQNISEQNNLEKLPSQIDEVISICEKAIQELETEFPA